MDVNIFINKMMDFYNVFTVNELSGKIGISQQAISKWRKNNSITAIQKKCRELGIYNEIFGDLNTNINNYQNSTNVVAQDFSSNNNGQYTQNNGSKDLIIDENILKLVDTLCSFAKANNKVDELKKDLSSLLPKYM